MKPSRLVLLTSLAILGASTLAHAAPTPTKDDLTMTSREDQRPAVRTIEIEGVRVRITLTVQNYLTRTAHIGQGPALTLINARLETEDGSPLPLSVSVTRVRLQRVAAPFRVFWRDMTEFASIPEILDQREYGADEGIRLTAGTRLRSALRLEIAGTVRIVTMGVLRVLPASYSN